jgi:hypothetical protein
MARLGGQGGNADGYVLQGKEPWFCLRKIKAWKGKVVHPYVIKVFIVQCPVLKK